MITNNIKLKWEKVEGDFLKTIYSLWWGEQEIANLSYHQGQWSLIPFFYSNEIKNRYYNYYGEDDVQEVQFKAILDIMAVLSKIGTECFECCNSISDYITEYLMNMERNEEIANP